MEEVFVVVWHHVIKNLIPFCFATGVLLISDAAASTLKLNLLVFSLFLSYLTNFVLQNQQLVAFNEACHKLKSLETIA